MLSIAEVSAPFASDWYHILPDAIFHANAHETLQIQCHFDIHIPYLPNTKIQSSHSSLDSFMFNPPLTEHQKDWHLLFLVWPPTVSNDPVLLLLPLDPIRIYILEEKSRINVQPLAGEPESRRLKAA
jgi:hypothetical protein